VSKGGQSVTFTTHLVPRSSKSRTIPLHTFCAVLPAAGWNHSYSCLNFTNLQAHNLLYIKVNKFLSFFLQFYLKLEMFQTNFVQKINKHILCSILFDNHSTYEIM